MHNGKAKKLLFIHNGSTSFVRIDIELLREHFAVTELYLRSPRFNLVSVLHQVTQHDLIFGWFASWHTLAPVMMARRLGKPAILIVGGYDTANVPQANYGSQRGGMRRWIASTAMRQAAHLITNSNSAKYETIANVSIPAQKITVIYHGVPEIPPGDLQVRRPIALTVGGVWQENLLRKGLLPFVKTARLLPQLQFVLVGKWQDDSINTLRGWAGANVKFTGFIKNDELVKLYQTASVYVQVSLHEGFGMSVAEAMLGGCIPIVSDRGSLPEVVGECGILLEQIDPEVLAYCVDEVVSAGPVRRQAARNRVLEKFSPTNRSQQLLDLLGQY